MELLCDQKTFHVDSPGGDLGDLGSIFVTLEFILVTLGSILVTLGCILVTLGSEIAILGSLDGHLGGFYGLLGSTFEVSGWLRGHFGDSLLTFVGNVGSYKMY